MENNNPTVFVCTVCSTKCSTKSNLNRHMKKFHEFVSTYKKPSLKCPLCGTSEINNCRLLDKHLLSSHAVVTKYKKLSFDSQKAFKEWKLDFEKKTKSFFCYYNSRRIGTKRCKITKYICHRSGTYTTQQKSLERQRKIKLKGSNKIDSQCPARIIAKENNNGRVKVEVMETHIGHEAEVRRLRLTKSEREAVAEKLLKGIPICRILEDIRKTFNPDDRASYTTNHDIHNIKQSFNVQSDTTFHNDAASVNILIRKFQELHENPILAYKPYGVEDEEVGTNNLFLIFMNAAQLEMLEKHGDNILMICSTHDTNLYQIQLTTLMVVDANNEGFPVAVLWSKLQMENIFRKFFAFIKQKVSNLNPKLFMSDDTNVYYDAFTKEYNNHPQKLLCDWHLKKNLFSNLSKISEVKKRREVRKLIKSLIYEVNTNIFHELHQNTIEKLYTDPETKNYGEYFYNNYSNRPMQWAHCFRKGFHKNTNMPLEKWHQELKCNLLVGEKCQQKLDVSIAKVIECLQQKFLRKGSVNINTQDLGIAKQGKLFISNNLEKIIITDSSNCGINEQGELSMSNNSKKRNSLGLRKKRMRDKLATLISVVENCDSVQTLSYTEENINTLLLNIQILSDQPRS